MNKINSFEDACLALNIQPALPEVAQLPLKHQKALLAHYKLITICEAMNEGWQPDWYNTSEVKYTVYYKIQADPEHPSGVGFSSPGYDFWHSRTSVGSRLCFKSAALALEAAEKFKDLFQDYFLIS